MFEISGVCKRFVGVLALDHVDFALKQGEIHGLLGENGAGKSTLMKIISGVYTYDEGEIRMEKEVVQFHSPRDALKCGISIISQELSLCEDLSVAENIHMGHLPEKAGGLIDWTKINTQSIEAMRDLGMDINPRLKVKHLSTSQKQLVEIAKAVSRNCKILLMDEPTSALAQTEVDHLFLKMRELAKRGISIVFISHKLDEVYTVCDRITLLRDGRKIDTYMVGEKTQNKTIELMIGKPLDEYYATNNTGKITSKLSTEVIMTVKNLCTENKLKNISFSLHKGEILGLYGLMGSGRTEVLRALYGADKVNSMELTLNGKQLTKLTPAKSIQNGIVLIPEERKLQSLYLELSVSDNICIPNLNRLCAGPIVKSDKRDALVDDCITRMGVKTPGRGIKIKYLSGGNQQKVIIGRWLANQPKVLLMDEPTKGIDVGAKSEIYSLIHKFSQQGYSVLCVSSEISEIKQLCDRVILIRDGKLEGELERSEINLSNISEALAVEHL